MAAASKTACGTASFLLLAAMLGCGDDRLTREEVIAECRADPAAKCCQASDCGEGSYCDISYVCSPEPDYGITCDPPSGSRTCHRLCAEDPKVCEQAGESCAKVSLAAGSDIKHTFDGCVPTSSTARQ